MSKPTLNFYTKPRQKQFTVMGRITYNRRKSEFATDVVLINDSLENLSEKEQQKLTDFRIRFEKLLAGLEYNEITDFDAKHLRDKLLNRSPKKSDLIAFLLKQQEAYAYSRDYSVSTKQLYTKTIEYFLKFIREAEKANHYPFSKVDKEMIKRYDEYLKRLTSSNDTSKLLHQNTIAKHHSRSRSILYKAVDSGLLDKNPYTRQKLIKYGKTRITHLKLHELEKLKAAPLGENLKLDVARDYFLFTVYTGIRYSDLSTLKRTAIYKEKEQWLITNPIKKTSDVLNIPFLDGGKRIFDKYSNHPECEITGLVLPQLSNQKLNEYLKSIQEIAGIETLLTHHVARHTCATMLLSNAVSISVVQRTLGHSDLKTTQRYAKLVPQFMNQEMNKVNGAF